VEKIFLSIALSFAAAVKIINDNGGMILEVSFCVSRDNFQTTTELRALEEVLRWALRRRGEKFHENSAFAHFWNWRKNSVLYELREFRLKSIIHSHLALSEIIFVHIL
jgi:hypothetical protein